MASEGVTNPELEASLAPTRSHCRADDREGSTMATILAIGELLWDVFPDERRLGGAPANVAYHLAQIGHHVHLASAVGADDLGRRALARLAESGVEIELVRVNDARPTGTVEVKLDERGVPTFHIARDVAWDHIPVTDALLHTAASADAIVFGTLAQREMESRASILRVADAAPGLRVLDLNLRPPFQEPSVIRAALTRADVLKLNEDEAAGLPTLLNQATSASFLPELARTHSFRRIYVTRGAEGCDVVEGETTIRASAPSVSVADTVGAGDAFTAALVDGEIRGLPAARIAANACAAGAFVASRSGAMPAWTDELREQLGISR
jgi:fructokinase